MCVCVCVCTSYVSIIWDMRTVVNVYWLVTAFACSTWADDPLWSTHAQDVENLLTNWYHLWLASFLNIATMKMRHRLKLWWTSRYLIVSCLLVIFFFCCCCCCFVLSGKMPDSGQVLCKLKIFLRCKIFQFSCIHNLIIFKIKNSQMVCINWLSGRLGRLECQAQRS